MHQSDIINQVIATRAYGSYLEIGVLDPAGNFDLVQCKLKHGVDPAPLKPCTFVMTSDEFFRSARPPGQMYDLIFIDGLHLQDQVLRDVRNSLDCLSAGGTILLHDCNPKAKLRQLEHKVPGHIWNGDVWKAVVRIRATRDDLVVITTNVATGMTALWRGHQEPLTGVPAELDYAFLAGNRRRLLNLVPVDKFMAAIAARKDC